MKTRKEEDMDLNEGLEAFNQKLRALRLEGERLYAERAAWLERLGYPVILYAPDYGEGWEHFVVSDDKEFLASIRPGERWSGGPHLSRDDTFESISEEIDFKLIGKSRDMEEEF